MDDANSKTVSDTQHNSLTERGETWQSFWEQGCKGDTNDPLTCYYYLCSVIHTTRQLQF